MARFFIARARAREALLEARTTEGHWTGELSTSALSTATAVAALTISNSQSRKPDPTLGTLADRGIVWLAENQNADGGWGDTARSISNISTTTLCWAAFGAVPGAADRHRMVVSAAETWLRKMAGSLDPEPLARAIIARYGTDRTFSVPILTMCALAGRLGRGRDAWHNVLSLPFELAALPHQFFAALRLPVVSYALPALIAIGQARHFHRPSRNPFAWALRSLTKTYTLDVLEKIQPANGGFLEATPLTSFVVMSLAGSGQLAHPVTQRGLSFLRASVRPDGSWPIDTNLATWMTTLSIDALRGNSLNAVPEEERQKLRSWLLDQQFRQVHPYTRAAPGGWAWTDLPGGVPDADDTAGAVLALRHLGEADERVRAAAALGIEWLLNLQNRDGGIPTFCRGWGTLPFDRSGPDLTAHAVRAWLAWRDILSAQHQTQVTRAVQRAIGYLAKTQRPDGSWVPLWFGNQFVPGDENPFYGTARVLCALSEAASKHLARVDLVIGRGVRWLLDHQNPDGTWGNDGKMSGTTEETALCLEALAAICANKDSSSPPQQYERMRGAIQKATEWVVAQVESGTWREPAPIGFYFAKLWYYDRLYPIIFTGAALERASEALKEY